MNMLHTPGVGFDPYCEGYSQYVPDSQHSRLRSSSTEVLRWPTQLATASPWVLGDSPNPASTMFSDHRHRSRGWHRYANSLPFSTPEYVQFGEEASNHWHVSLDAGSVSTEYATPAWQMSQQIALQSHPPEKLPSQAFDFNSYSNEGHYHSLQATQCDVVADTSHCSSGLASHGSNSFTPKGMTSACQGSNPIVRNHSHRPDDMYSPHYIRGFGIDREGYCALCSPCRWLKIKNSEYWYDKVFKHGISATSGQLFQLPTAVRQAGEDVPLLAIKPKPAAMPEGRCPMCSRWIPLGKLRDGRVLGVVWIRHAIGVCIHSLERTQCRDVHVIKQMLTNHSVREN